MDCPESTRLDTEFDQVLVEMKPHVLRLPHKSGQQSFIHLMFPCSIHVSLSQLIFIMTFLLHASEQTVKDVLFG